MIKAGTWVRIHRIIIEAKDRAATLPIETQKVPLEMWLKGYLLEDAKIGDYVKIKTITNRLDEGYLIEVNPSFKHNYGDFVPEILEIDQLLNKTLWGNDNE